MLRSVRKIWVLGVAVFCVMMISFVNADGTAFAEGDLPREFDLRNVDGKSYVTPLKAQGGLGVCWAFATVEQVESLIMIQNNAPYDENTTIFSVRQMDYATGNASINDYDNENGMRTLGGGGNYYMSSIAMANGIALTDDEVMPYTEGRDKKELYEVLNYGNSLYEVDETAMIYEMGDREAYNEAIKYGVMVYGGAYVGTMSPIGKCGTMNVDGSIVVGVDVMCVDAGEGHGMHIIGWDDDYAYSYCKEGIRHVRNNGGCGGEVVNGTGAWIVRNSWGPDLLYGYIYLTYDSIDMDIEFTTKVSQMADRAWDNNYHENVYKYLDANGGATTATSDTMTIKKVIPGEEKVEKVKFWSYYVNGTYTVTIKSATKVYENIATVETSWPGIYTVDLNALNVVVPEDEFDVIVTAVDGDGLLLKYTISVFTSNIDDAPVIYTEPVESEPDALSAGDFSRVVYSVTKNIPGNGVIKYSLTRGGEDMTEYLGMENGIVAENNINARMTIAAEAGYGNYVLTMQYGGKSYSTNVAVRSGVAVGDVSGDNKVSSADYVKIRKHIMGTAKISDSRYGYAADINKDGKITSADYIKIRKYIMNGGTW